MQNVASHPEQTIVLFINNPRIVICARVVAALLGTAFLLEPITIAYAFDPQPRMVPLGIFTGIGLLLSSGYFLMALAGLPPGDRRVAILGLFLFPIITATYVAIVTGVAHMRAASVLAVIMTLFLSVVVWVGPRSTSP